jgi:hypothetical protein
MRQTFELLVATDHPEVSRLRYAVSQYDSQLTIVPSAGWGAAVNGRSHGSTNSQSLADWIIMADAKASFVDADFENLSNILQFASTAVWLQPWNNRCLPGLYAWQNCAPRCASLWSNPSPALAVCLHRQTLLSALAQFDSAVEVSQQPIWEILIRIVAQGHRVGFPELSPVPPGIDCLESVHFPKLVPSLNDFSENWLRQFVLPLKPSQLVAEKRSDADAVALKAGICQWHGWLDESHQLSQSIEGLGAHHAGDYWHAIMHRREPDYSNAKYWFRQLGRHSVFSQLASFVDAAFDSTASDGNWRQKLTARGTWDPFAFVDFCEACSPDESSSLAIAARRLQAVEMRLLLTATYLDASFAG